MGNFRSIVYLFFVSLVWSSRVGEIVFRAFMGILVRGRVCIGLGVMWGGSRDRREFRV